MIKSIICDNSELKLRKSQIKVLKELLKKKEELESGILLYNGNIKAKLFYNRPLKFIRGEFKSNEWTVGSDNELFGPFVKSFFSSYPYENLEELFFLDNIEVVGDNKLLSSFISKKDLFRDNIESIKQHLVEGKKLHTDLIDFFIKLPAHVYCDKLDSDELKHKLKLLMQGYRVSFQ